MEIVMLSFAKTNSELHEYFGAKRDQEDGDSQGYQEETEKNCIKDLLHQF